MEFFTLLICALVIYALAVGDNAVQGLIGHWKLQDDCRDYSGMGNHGIDHGVRFIGDAAKFDGGGAYIEVPHSQTLHIGTADFTISAWVKCSGGAQVIGDILTKYDANIRKGINLCVSASSPGYNSVSDVRNLQFGIDNAVEGEWLDCGRPWIDNPLISTLAVYNGHLYTGTSDSADPERACHVYRYGGGSEWIDCGRVSDDLTVPSINTIAVHRGSLYAGTGVWDWYKAWHRQTGRVHVYRYEGGSNWHDCGQVGDGCQTKSLASFDGNLFVSDDMGFIYRYDGDGNWTVCGEFGSNYVHAMMVYDGHLYGAAFGPDYIYRYDGGTKWTPVADEALGWADAQFHTMEVYRGRLYLGTWPNGDVLRYEGGTVWTDCGWMGVEEMIQYADGGIRRPNEVNDLTVYNGKLYAGVIPKAEVWRYEEGTEWSLVKQLVENPDYSPALLPTWMRVPCMTVYQGRFYAGTGTCEARTSNANLSTNAGKVFSWEAGKSVSFDDDLGTGWRHIVAVRQQGSLRLYIDGSLSAVSSEFDPSAYDISNDESLLIGFGSMSYFRGNIQDVRLYNHALSGSEAKRLSELTKGSLGSANFG